MLPTNLLSYEHEGAAIVPRKLPLDREHFLLAAELIQQVKQAQGQTQGTLDRHLQELEGNSMDFRMRRGLVHILKSSFCQFEVVSPIEPSVLRHRVFEQAARGVPHPQRTVELLTAIATELSQSLNQTIEMEAVRQGLYGDLVENRILTEFKAPSPTTLIHRYNLAQVQGIFYRASHIIIHAYRNDPGEYKLLFRYLKLFGLMAYIEGDADQGFTITIDGPTSLFKPSTRYGLAIAKLIPALLHVTKWRLDATLLVRGFARYTVLERDFSLNSQCGLVSHYPPGKPYDSMIEESFAKGWALLKTEWRLEREVDLIPIPGSVMIPDFRLVHPDGREFLLEIVGYWRPEYLRKKFSQVKQSQRDNLILAVSQRLNLEKAGVDLQDVHTPIVWFKEKLAPRSVLALLI